MKREGRIILCIVFIITGFALIGYGHTGIDFALSNSWEDPEQWGDNFPVFGYVDDVTGFILSMMAVGIGFCFLILAGFVGVWNYSTIKWIPVIAIGAALMGLGIWGVAFAMKYVETNLLWGDENVGLPWTSPGCSTENPDCYATHVTANDWIIINLGLIGAGFVAMIIASLRIRWVRKTSG